MRNAISRVLIGAMAVLATPLLVPGPVASPQGAQCRCNATLSLDPDPNCICPGITVSNVITRKGRCGLGGGGACTGGSISNCKVSGTVSETGCLDVVGFIDEPFQIESNCNSLGLTTPWFILCTDGGGQHSLLLDCEACH